MAGKRGWRRAALAVMAVAAAAPLALPASSAWAAGEAEGEQQTGAAAAGIAVDESDRLPALKTNEVTGDFLGLGYDQRAALEEPGAGTSVKLRIYDRNGSKLKETTLGVGDWNKAGAHFGLAEKAHLSGVKIAAGGDGHLYVAGYGKVTDTAWGSAILKIDPRPGEMKQVGNVVLGNVAVPEIAGTWAPIVTSLDVGLVNGTEILAAGQSAAGVRFYSTGDMASQGAMFEDWNRNPEWGWARDLVSAVKFSGAGAVKTPEGAQVTGLAVGRLAYDAGSYSTHALYLVDPAAKKILKQDVETAHYGSGEMKAPAAFAFDDDNARLAVSWWREKDGDEPLETRSSSGLEVLEKTVGTVAPAGRLSYVMSASEGVSQLVFGSRDTTGSKVFVKKGADLEAVPLSLGVTEATDHEIRSWFPGYKSLRLNVVNTTGKALEVRLKSSDSADRGCWSNIRVGERTAFPASYSVAPGGQSPDFASVVLTAGPGGVCGTEERRFGYVEVQAAGDPGSRSVVKLKQEKDQLSAVEQVGRGALKITAGNRGGIGGGEQQLVVSSPADPDAVRAPQVTGKRLTTTSADGDAARPVYRFDVSDAAWKVPGADTDLTDTQLPAMTVQASTNGLVWDDLGKLKPVTAPSLSGDVVTLGKSSFYWENTKDARQYTKIRVKSGDMASQPVVLGDLPAPSLGSEKLSLSLLRPVTETPLRANGIDQEPVELILKSSTSPALGASAPEYDRLFYRDGDKKLITGLLDDSNPYQAAVSALRGPYLHEDDALMRTSGAERFRAYLTTASASPDQRFTAYFQNPGDKQFTPSSAIAVTPRADKLKLAAVPGGMGVEVEKQSPTDSCKEGACRIADTRTGPALYQAPDPARIGISLRTEVTTDSASLPLLAPGVDTGRFPDGEKLRKSAVVTVNRSTAEVENKNEWSSKISGALVSHGDWIEIAGFPAQ
ncbi:hypothetical protein [Streptomyces sp. NPDC096030]|uniref:hypothetical protein n=1 Tax=Streptomyces sp. NPDC096030 TaxID=3155423 RepID=UPI003317B6F6